MKYRPFAPGNTEISLLGFGAMRLPTIGGKAADINEDEAVKMIRYAVDHGVNYVDTAYVYHGGASEVVVGKALKDGYRERVKIATKLPFWILKSPEDMEKTLEEQLRRLDAGYIDFYLLHDIEGDRWKQVKDWNMFDFLQKKKAEGKIRFAGFSCHGENPAYFKEVLDAYPWDFCQIQLNYLDQNIQAGIEGYGYAASKGVPVVVMEPLKGGKLTDALPESIQKYWDGLKSDRSPAEWALRWVANLPGVTTILSGMSNMAQVEENVRVLSDAEANTLSDAELSAIDKVADVYNSMIAYQCTGCRYCMPCASDIDIPLVMNFRNSWDIFEHNPKMRGEFAMFVKSKPSACVSCGKCESECPQHLAIPQAMREAAAIFE